MIELSKLVMCSVVRILLIICKYSGSFFSKYVPHKFSQCILLSYKPDFGIVGYVILKKKKKKSCTNSVLLCVEENIKKSKQF